MLKSQVCYKRDEVWKKKTLSRYVIQTFVAEGFDVVASIFYYFLILLASLAILPRSAINETNLLSLFFLSFNNIRKLFPSIF